MKEPICSDAKLTWPSQGIVLGYEDQKKIRDAISNMEPLYPGWDEKSSLVENIIDAIKRNDSYVEDNYRYDDPYSYDYSISDSWCPNCDA